MTTRSVVGREVPVGLRQSFAVGGPPVRCAHARIAATIRSPVHALGIWLSLRRGRYWAGDVAGERGGTAAALRLVGDGGNPEALYELLDSDVEMTISPDDLEGGRYVGHAGVREFFRRWAGTWETWHLHPERMIDAGQGQAVVGLQERGLGKGSGAAVEKRTGQVWTFRDGLVVRWENFNSLAEALEAAGLRE